MDDESEGEEGYKQGGYHRVHIGDVYNNRYKVLTKLGWGHFSTYVALKVQKSAKHYTEAAMDEIAILTRLKTGPNGIHVCFIFEMLGENLLSLIKQYHYHGIPLPIVKKITKDVCKGMAFLHSKCSIIHTDLKPENILISIPQSSNNANGGEVSSFSTNNPNPTLISTKILKQLKSSKSEMSSSKRKRLKKKLKKLYQDKAEHNEKNDKKSDMFPIENSEENLQNLKKLKNDSEKNEDNAILSSSAKYKFQKFVIVKHVKYDEYSDGEFGFEILQCKIPMNEEAANKTKTSNDKNDIRTDCSTYRNIIFTSLSVARAYNESMIEEHEQLLQESEENEEDEDIDFFHSFICPIKTGDLKFSNDRIPIQIHDIDDLPSPPLPHSGAHYDPTLDYANLFNKEKNLSSSVVDSKPNPNLYNSLNTSKKPPLPPGSLTQQIRNSPSDASLQKNSPSLPPNDNDDDSVGNVPLEDMQIDCIEPTLEPISKFDWKYPPRQHIFRVIFAAPKGVMQSAFECPKMKQIIASDEQKEKVVDKLYCEDDDSTDMNPPLRDWHFSCSNGTDIMGCYIPPDSDHKLSSCQSGIATQLDDGRDIQCKVVDLGNACWKDRHFSDDIQTRQYRCPEVILGAKYCTPADMWSVSFI
eukprot:GSMAST32.ASY1.ANO1.1684.1 assembled CDS